MAVRGLGITMDDALARRSFRTTGGDMMAYLLVLKEILDDDDRFIEIHEKALEIMHGFCETVDETCVSDCEIAIMIIAMEQSCMLTFLGMDERMKMASELSDLGFDMGTEGDDAVDLQDSGDDIAEAGVRDDGEEAGQVRPEGDAPSRDPRSPLPQGPGLRDR